MDALLTDDFTFSSAAGDDHISKSTFKKQCWETQLGFIERFELEQVFGGGNEALVKYLSAAPAAGRDAVRSLRDAGGAQAPGRGTRSGRNQCGSPGCRRP